jgi:hypothetical protein
VEEGLVEFHRFVDALPKSVCHRQDATFGSQFISYKRGYNIWLRIKPRTQIFTPRVSWQWWMFMGTVIIPIDFLHPQDRAQAHASWLEKATKTIFPDRGMVILVTSLASLRSGGGKTVVPQFDS